MTAKAAAAPSTAPSTASTCRTPPTPSDEVDARRLAIAREVLAIEAEAVAALADRLDSRFTEAVRLILACRGRVAVSGIGKTGHIARKLASTLASTGTPAFFIHAAEASHGDLGMLTSDDVLIALSYSGESAELTTIVPLVKRLGAKLIVFSGAADSSLVRNADVHLDTRVAKEACPLNLAPTASTTAALALGDALAVALLEARGFGPDDFARSHPGGSLGRRLLTLVSDVMRTGEAVPSVAEGASLTAAILEMSRKGMGMTAIVGPDQTVRGIFTDGDLRRAIERGVDLRTVMVADLMTASPATIASGKIAAEAARIMDEGRKNQLLVADEQGRLIGALSTHDLFRAKVI